MDSIVEDVVQAKEAKKDIEHKVQRILKLIKNNGQDKKGKIPEDSRTRSELIGLIQEFHKQYQSLYAQYDNLRGEMETRVHSKKEKEKSSSTSNSDSEEYYSSEETENGLLVDKRNKAEFEIAGLKHVLNTTTAENESVNSEYMTAFGKSPKGEAVKKDHKNRERKRELSTLVKVQEVHGSQASAQIKELEGQLTVIRMDLESSRRLKNDLEIEIEEKETEARQIEETDIRLRERISELELMIEEKENEISAMTVKMKKNECKFTTKIEDLMAQVESRQMEMDSLHAEKAELEESQRNKESAQVKSLKDKANIMQQELESVHREKTEMQLQLDMKIKENGKNLVQVKTLKDEIARNNVFVQGLHKEKEGFLAQMENLKLEVNSIHDQNNVLKEVIRSRNREMDELREEKGRLQTRISELEGKLSDKGDEFDVLQKKDEAEENGTSTQIMELKAQVNNLLQELNSLQNEKSKLEAQNNRLKQDLAQNQTQVENEILNLTSKIEDQQKNLKEKEDSIKNFTEENKLFKRHSLDLQKQRPTEFLKYQSTDSSKLSQHVFERKIEELAVKFHMKMENHIRLLSQRIRVAEQIHVETRESFKRIKEKIDQEKQEFDEKKAVYEAEVKKMNEMLLAAGSNVLSGLDLMVKKLDQENDNLLNRISRISNELQVAKNWMTGQNNEIKNLKHKLESLTSQEGFLVREKMGKLETEPELKGGMGRMEEDKLINAANQAERKVEDLERQLKEKNEVLSSLGEEKREAIRQLCVLIDYHRHRYDDLKEAVSKMPTVRFKKPA